MFNTISPVQTTIALATIEVDTLLDRWQAWSDKYFSEVQDIIAGVISLFAYSLGFIAAMAWMLIQLAAFTLYLTNIACVPNTFPVANPSIVGLLPEAPLEIIEVTETTYDELMSMTIRQLKGMARNASIKNYGRMRKSQLAEALQ